MFPISPLLSILWFLSIRERVQSFSAIPTNPLSRRCSRRTFRGNRLPFGAAGRVIPAPLFLLTASSKQPPISSSEILQISDELVQELLLQSDQRRQERITSLAKQLVQSKVTFDPKECLDGPLFFSNVLEGPSPLWERLGFSLPFTNKNLQGQQYTYNDNEKSVINYAEVFGSALHLRAYGSYEQDMSSPLLSQSPNEKDDETAGSFFQKAFSSLLPPGTSQQDTLLTCPIDFVVTVNKASICFGNDGNGIDIPIAGKGYLRVLYADPQLRIFISPQSTTDDRWEKAGLMVAQIRVDQRDPTFGLLSIRQDR